MGIEKKRKTKKSKKLKPKKRKPKKKKRKKKTQPLISQQQKVQVILNAPIKARRRKKRAPKKKQQSFFQPLGSGAPTLFRASFARPQVLTQAPSINPQAQVKPNIVFIQPTTPKPQPSSDNIIIPQPSFTSPQSQLQTTLDTANPQDELATAEFGASAAQVGSSMIETMDMMAVLVKILKEIKGAEEYLISNPDTINADDIRDNLIEKEIFLEQAITTIQEGNPISNKMRAQITNLKKDSKVINTVIRKPNFQGIATLQTIGAI